MICYMQSFAIAETDVEACFYCPDYFYDHYILARHPVVATPEDSAAVTP